MKTKELYPNWTLLNFSNVQHLPYHFQSWLLVYKFPCLHKTIHISEPAWVRHSACLKTWWSINNLQMQWVFKCTQFKTGSISSLHVVFSYPFFDAWSRWKHTRLTCEPLQTKISMQCSNIIVFHKLESCCRSFDNPKFRENNSTECAW